MFDRDRVFAEPTFAHGRDQLLSLLRTQGAAEFLLLPKADSAALALGEGLRLAGAADGVSYLQQLAH